MKKDRAENGCLTFIVAMFIAIILFIIFQASGCKEKDGPQPPTECEIDSVFYWFPGDPYYPGDSLHIFMGCDQPDSIFYVRIPPGNPGSIASIADLPDSAYWGAGPQEPPLLTGDEWNESLYFWLMGNIINMKSDPPIPNGTSPYERIDTLYVEFDSVYWHGYLTVQETEELNRLIALYLDGLEK